VATAVAATPTHVDPLRRLSWRHPEWPWAVLAASAWSILIVQDAVAAASTSGTSLPSHHPTVGWWMLMTIAMMVPAALPTLREISLESLWERRYLAAATFLVGYLAAWGAFGAAALGIWSLAGPSSLIAPFLAGAALLVGALWGLTRAKRRSLKRCHRYVPLPPRGRTGDRACLHFGFYNGRQCVGVCWPVMLAMVPGHALLAMLGLTALVTWERMARVPRLHVTASILAAAGSITVLVAV